MAPELSAAPVMGREYSLEFYNLLVREIYIGVYKASGVKAHVLLYEERKGNSINIIYVMPQWLKIKGEFVVDTGLWENIIIEPILGDKNARKFEAWSIILSQMKAGNN